MRLYIDKKRSKFATRERTCGLLDRNHSWHCWLGWQYADWSQAQSAQCGYRSRTPDGGAIVWFSGFLNSWLTI